MVQLTLRENCIHVLVEEHDDLLVFGRQEPDEECPHAVKDLNSLLDLGEPPPLKAHDLKVGRRVIITGKENVNVGRKHLRLERTGTGYVRLTNIHKSLDVIVDGKVIARSSSCEVMLPSDLQIGNLHLRIEAEEFRTILGANQVPPSSTTNSLAADLRGGDHRSLLYRLTQLVAVLQASASSPDFMIRIAKVAVKLIDLDHAAVVLWKEDRWVTVAYSSARPNPSEASWSASYSLLNRVLSNQETMFSGPERTQEANVHSLKDVVAYVASPIRSPSGEVIGALYGDRRTGIGGFRQTIDETDAQFVEILACGIAGGLQRIENEREVLTRRLQFEQVVTKEVADQIEKDPESLAGRDANVSILFCDIAGFSRISELLTPKQTFEWIKDVMETLSACVIQNNGTIVDYVGDELIAMWGAPFANENHASQACRAAIAMIESLPKIDATWLSHLNAPTQVGIGINSGKVRVGNLGCQFKLKYGPLGSTVNIASRVQGATRYLRTPVLVTGDTAELLTEEFSTRRLCQVKVKNIDKPIDIYELAITPSDDWTARCDDYARALSSWEGATPQDAVGQLVRFVANYEEDVPAKVMLSRAIDVWARDEGEHDPVWKLPSK